MPKHEFGIMKQNPKPGIRYDEYEPGKYGCIAVEDEIIEKIRKEVSRIDTFWHTVDKPEKGLAYCGITLISPESSGSFIAITNDIPELSELNRLLRQAQSQNRFIIHFGV